MLCCVTRTWTFLIDSFVYICLLYAVPSPVYKEACLESQSLTLFYIFVCSSIAFKKESKALY